MICDSIYTGKLYSFRGIAIIEFYADEVEATS